MLQPHRCCGLNRKETLWRVNSACQIIFRPLGFYPASGLAGKNEVVALLSVCASRARVVGSGPAGVAATQDMGAR